MRFCVPLSLSVALQPPEVFLKLFQIQNSEVSLKMPATIASGTLGGCPFHVYMVSNQKNTV